MESSQDQSSTDMECKPPRPSKICTYCLRYFISTVFVVSATLFVIFAGRHYIKGILLWIQDQPFWIGILIFFLLFIAVSFPMMWGYVLLNVAIGYIYGIVQGVLVVMFCALSGTFIAHLVLAQCCRDCVRKKIASYGVSAFLALVNSNRGFKVIVLARLTPIPYGLQNAIFALCNVRLWMYMLATWLGLLPTQVLNTYIGSTLRSMEDVLSENSNSTTGYIVFTAQIVLTIVLMVYVVRWGKHQLLEQLNTISPHSSTADLTALLTRTDSHEHLDVMELQTQHTNQAFRHSNESLNDSHHLIVSETNDGCYGNGTVANGNAIKSSDVTKM